MGYTGCEPGRDEDVYADPEYHQYRTQRVGIAVSDNLHDWEKLPENPVTTAAPAHYEERSTGQREMVHWRDPFHLEHQGELYQLVTARRRDGDVTTRGTVALARSRDMHDWQVLPPLEHDRVSEEMELSQVNCIDGRWYLMFCTKASLLSPGFKDRFPDHQWTEYSTYSLVGESALGPYRIHGTGEVIVTPPADWFYAQQLVCFKGSWWLLGTIHDPEKGQWISDPFPLTADETGVHACG
jgi:hypothetical protein